MGMAMSRAARPPTRRCAGTPLFSPLRKSCGSISLQSCLFLALLHGLPSLTHAQTRPLVNPEEQAEALEKAAAAALAAARAWRIEPSIGLTVTTTSNSGLSFSPTKPEKDVITDIEPRLLVRGRGVSFTLEGNLGARGLIYANSTQENRILPSGTLALNVNLIDRWLYFDTSALLEQVAADPYTTRADDASSVNKINSLQYRFSPYLQHSFTPSLSLVVRSDNIWTKRRGEFNQTDPRRNSRQEKESLFFEQRPLPFGFSIEASQETTSYDTGIETILQIGSARAVVSYALDPTFVIGIVGGSEKSEYSLSTSTDNISGVRILWLPTERTELKANYEQRFFGTGGSLQWSHRSPFIGFYLNVSRQPSALGTSFVLNPSGGDVQTLLDAIFKTRYPNPADRAVIVNNVISGLGISSGLGQPVEVFSDYAQLTSSATASAVFQGVRSTVATRLFWIRSRQLNPESTPLVPTLGIAADNAQRGLSIDFNRRLTRTLSADLGLGYSLIEGLGVAQGQSTKNMALRLGFTQALTPKTKVTLGARYLRTDLVTAGQGASAKEAATFVGLTHRF
jgi:uncharacterized protein (PEP-CTERM system associated)